MNVPSYGFPVSNSQMQHSGAEWSVTACVPEVFCTINSSLFYSSSSPERQCLRLRFCHYQLHFFFVR